MSRSARNDLAPIGIGANQLYSAANGVSEASMLRMVKLVIALASLVAVPALADEAPTRRHYYQRYIYLPPERHVIEVVQPPGSGNFIINGKRFTAKTAACDRWAAGERIKLLAGDWNGQCVDAVFYNVQRRSTCEMWCRPWW